MSKEDKKAGRRYFRLTYEFMKIEGGLVTPINPEGKKNVTKAFGELCLFTTENKYPNKAEVTKVILSQLKAMYVFIHVISEFANEADFDEWNRRPVEEVK
jgi:hypothetical protein